jgi:hypothetical protein
MSSIYRTWMERIFSGEFSKSQAQQWAHVVWPLSRGEGARGKRTNLTVEEAEKLLQTLVARGGVKLTESHTKQGLGWIADRRNRDAFPAWVHEDFSHFLFLGQGYNTSLTSWAQYTPIWRIVGNHGQVLDYAASAWQTGATGPRILNATAS